LVQAINDFITTWNKSGKAFKWTKPAGAILKSINTAKGALSISL
jgi:hypothetical protein